LLFWGFNLIMSVSCRLNRSMRPWLITKGGLDIVCESTDGHSSNRCLELDQRVATVMAVGWKSFTVGTEVHIITDSTLVADASDVALGRLVFTQGPITENTKVDFDVTVGLLPDGLVKRGKAMTRVVLGSMNYAVWAVVPVRAGEALVPGP
jgi:hypothetical protein